MTLARGVVLVLAAALTAISFYELYRADAGVLMERSMLGATPITVFSTVATRSAPVVVISHGFAGSQQLMEPFAVTLARNGFIAVTFDYFGHGRNAEPLRGDVTQVEGATQYLIEQTRAVVEYALSLPRADGRLALLGHSMASDIIVRYAQSDPRVDATVAVSMFSPAVTPDGPKNLLVIVGDLEGFLKAEALRVLKQVSDSAEAGVTVVNADTGSARRVAFAPGVEHVGVLYSQTSMAEAAAWLDRVFTGDAAGAVDHRGPWIMLLLLGLITLAWPLTALLPTVSRPPVGASLGWRQLAPAALIPAIATPLLLFWFPADFMGMLVGGYLAVHFAVYGLISGIVVWRLRLRTPASTAGSLSVGRLVLCTLLAVAFCAGVIGWVLNSYVTSLAIPGLRAPLLLMMLLGTLLYFLSDEWMAQGIHTARGGHFFTRLCFLLSLSIAVALSLEELFFLVIIAAVIVIYFLVYGLFSRWIYQATGHPAVGAIANAVAFATALTAVFPLMSGA